jgi:Concanavalin A-like lectin/glucanases superfamily/Caspase domain
MAAQRRYRAMLVGNANFPDDRTELPPLNGPLVDIDWLGEALTDSEVGLFLPQDVQSLPDCGVQELREQLETFFAAASREDVLLFYYSGHGLLDLNNRLYLCARDTKTRILRSTALQADFINDLISECAAMSTIIVLDCCHSGAFKGAHLGALMAGKGRYVLASSRSTQLALDTIKNGHPSPFTKQLVRGLRDAVSEELLTVTELYRQVHNWITEASGPTPQLRFWGEGDVIIARRGDLLPLISDSRIEPIRASPGEAQSHSPSASKPLFLPKPVGAWPLDEYGGRIARDTVGSHDGKASGVDWGAGSGGAALFSGSYSEVATQGPVLKTGLDCSYTVSAWVQLDRTPGWFATAVSQSAGDVITFYLQYSWEDNRWAFSTQDRRALSFSPPILETWTHLVGVRRNDQLLLYVNGKKQNTVTTVFSKSESDQDSLYIGRALYNGEPGDWFPGSIKNVQVFDQALSTGQVEALYGQASGRARGPRTSPMIES